MVTSANTSLNTSEQKPVLQDDKKSTQQTSPSESATAEFHPSAKDHVLHEVSVEADGSEDPGAGIEQMVESKRKVVAVCNTLRHPMLLCHRHRTRPEVKRMWIGQQ